MTNVILQPASGVQPREHYRDTVTAPISLSRIRDHLVSADNESLSLAVGTDSTCVWGMRPPMASRWRQIEVGDKVMFAKDSRFFSLSTVRWKTISHSLALDLWGFHDSGDTWEFIYFFGPPEAIDIPYTEINAAIGYSPSYVPQGVNVLSLAKAQSVLEIIYGRYDPSREYNPASEAKTGIRGQGFNSASENRKTIELVAMNRAVEYYTSRGWDVKDVSGNRPYDLCCSKSGSEELHVEVKGTTGDGSSILLTRGEVRHAEEYAHVALYILHDLALQDDGSGKSAVGGKEMIYDPWNIKKGVREAISYEYFPARS